MNVFVLAILIYLLYRFIGGFLVPVIRASRQMRQQFHNMHQNASNNGEADPTQGNGFGSSGPRPDGKTQKSGSSKVGEYIDFEEVKQG
jgi:Domain of unknown function (DUF4834)